jgi:hypothetical protein
VYAEHQRYWIALLNLQRAWADDKAALAFIPPRHRDFSTPPDWPIQKALAYLLNNLELIRESYRRLEASETLDYDLFNHGLEGLTLRLQPWPSVADAVAASKAKAEVGGRLETLQVRSIQAGLNPGTRYIRATVQRSLYYFANYVDDRLSDPAYPAVSPDRWCVEPASDGGGDLVLVPPQAWNPDADESARRARGPA